MSLFGKKRTKRKGASVPPPGGCPPPAPPPRRPTDAWDTLNAIVLFLFAIQVRQREGRPQLAGRFDVTGAAVADFATLMGLVRAFAVEMADLLVDTEPRWEDGESLERSRVNELKARVRELESNAPRPAPDLAVARVMELAAAFLTAIGVRRHVNGDPSLPVELQPVDGEFALAYELCLVRLREHAPGFLDLLQVDEAEVGQRATPVPDVPVDVDLPPESKK